MSTVCVLQGDEGKPQHGASVPGERTTWLQTAAPTQPGLHAGGGMLQLPPACPGPASCIPAMLWDHNSIPPALGMLVPQQ